MPEDSKKNHDKKKSDPKDQRRPRQRHQQSAPEKRPEKKTEDPKNVPKVTIPQKPVYESPPPEFYKNLKRETDEILKITEEENTKYKKKEIQSNWSKYEVPIESYEEIEEQENLGADYEKLIQAPLSVGGHFQFKHEKSWDMNTGPSIYDKYFEINMEDLNVALCTIPFYERNSIEETNFSQTDILTMNNRSTRFKQKYFNDKSYSTPETDAQDKILSNLGESMKEQLNSEKDTSGDIEIKCDDTKTMPESHTTTVKLETASNTEPSIDLDNKIIDENVLKHEALINNSKPISALNMSATDHSGSDDHVFEHNNKPLKEPEVEQIKTQNMAEKSACPTEKTLVAENKVSPLLCVNVTLSEASVMHAVSEIKPAVSKDIPVQTQKNTVIESPEDLEKWLDDFLDG